ncbi:MAG: glycosyltransferase [Oscillospiraceae bacterium]|jgi:glycosyltransferase involved in cell wall biosynthesis|nr:glycosyltransferase [Oscillospiraceae bacterium]
MLKITVNILTTPKMLMQEVATRFLEEPMSDLLLINEDVILHNEAVEKLKSTLDITEKHAIAVGQVIENKKSLIKTANEYLPRYSITIDVKADCILIKRSVIDKLGFLDETYESLNMALLDFYCRINVYGFSTVVAHHAMYSYKNEEICNETNENDTELFLSRYAGYWLKKEKRFELYGENPCVRFLKLIDKDYYPKKRILFDCMAMPVKYCGTSEYLTTHFEAFTRLFCEKYEIFLYITREADEFFRFSEKYDNIYYPDTLEGKFHLGYAPNQLMFYEHQVTLNKHCLKIVQSILDIIIVRVDEHVAVDGTGDIELGIKLSDGIIFISDFSAKDFQAYFKTKELKEDSIKYKTIYITSMLEDPKKDDYELPFDEYFLIVGNSYKHKALNEAIEAVANTENNYIVLGYGDNEYIKDNVYGYSSGYLDDDFVSYLYKNCVAVVFPSLYEGFGLPIVVAFKNHKKVILNNNELSRELFKLFEKHKESMIFFDTFNEIPTIIDNVESFTDVITTYDDIIDRPVTEMEMFFDEILNTPVNKEKLTARYNMFSLISSRVETSVNNRIEPYVKENERLYGETQELIAEKNVLFNEKEELNATLNYMYAQFNDYKLMSMMKFALKEHIKHRRPGLKKIVTRNKPS